MAMVQAWKRSPLSKSLKIWTPPGATEMAN